MLRFLRRTVIADQPMITIIAPSLDDKRIYRIDALHAGTVHRCRNVLRHASGKGSNAARTAALLGQDVRLCTIAGEDLSAMLHAQLGAAGVLLDVTMTRVPTRSCITITERAGRATELVQEAHPLEADEAARFLDAAHEYCRNADLLLLAGSLPRGLPENFYLRCALEAHEGKVLLDAQAGPLLHALEAQPYCVKINREELAHSLGRKVDAAHTEDAARQLQRRGAQRVIITDVTAAVHILEADGRHYTLQPPPVSAVNPVGTGDAMSGPLAAALAQGRTFSEAAAEAVAAGAANAASLLPGDVDPMLVHELRKKIDMPHRK